MDVARDKTRFAWQLVMESVYLWRWVHFEFVPDQSATSLLLHQDTGISGKIYYTLMFRSAVALLSIWKFICFLRTSSVLQCCWRGRFCWQMQCKTFAQGQSLIFSWWHVSPALLFSFDRWLLEMLCYQPKSQVNLLWLQNIWTRFEQACSRYGN